MATYSADRGNGHTQPVCQNCATSTTPLWRRDENGSVLCNACGLFLKLHGTPRPISLKTDVIKSRNRVKTAGQGQKRKSLFESNGPAATSSDTDPPLPHVLNNQALSHNTTSNRSEHSNSPVSRTDTPALHQSSNIAPQHIFDGIPLADNVFHSPNISHFHQPSPSSTSAFVDRNQDPPQSYDALLQANTLLKTRVSELEVINDLYRGTVTQYEQGGAAPQAEMVPRDSEAQLRQLLEQSQRREKQLQQKVEELEHEVADLRGEQPPSKRTRLSDGPEYPEPPQVFSNGLDS